MRNGRVASGLALFLLPAALGCATKGYVDEQVKALDRRVDTAHGDLAQEVQKTSRDVSSLQGATNDLRDDLATTREIALGAGELREVERSRIYFAFDSDELDAEAKKTLDATASTLEANPSYVVNVLGFTDAIGSTRYNAELGRRRAESVIRYLVDATGDHLRRYAALSFGESAPHSEQSMLGEKEQRRQALVMILEPTTGKGAASDLSKR